MWQKGKKTWIVLWGWLPLNGTEFSKYCRTYATKMLSDRPNVESFSNLEQKGFLSLPKIKICLSGICLALFPPFQQPFLRRKGNKKAPPLKSTSGVQIVFTLPFPPSQIDRWRLSITLDSARNIIGGQGVVAKRKEGESGGDSTGKKRED